MEQGYNDEIEIDLKELFLYIKKKLIVIIFVGILGGVAAGLFSSFVLKPLFTSSTMIYILNKETTLTSLTDLQLGTQLTKDYRVLVTSRPVMKKVIDNLGLNIKYEDLLEIVSISNPVDTRILTISVEHQDPTMAKIIADEIALVSSQRIGEIMEIDPPKVIEEADVPVTKTSPSIKRYTILGGTGGSLAAGGILILLFVMNDKINNSDDIDKYLGLSTLGMIPIEEKKPGKKSRGKKGKIVIHE